MHLRAADALGDLGLRQVAEELQGHHGQLARRQAREQPVQGLRVLHRLEAGVSNGAAYTFMAVCLLVSALLMLAVTARGRRGAVPVPSGDAVAPAASRSAGS